MIGRMKVVVFCLLFAVAHSTVVLKKRTVPFSKGIAVERDWLRREHPNDPGKWQPFYVPF